MKGTRLQKPDTGLGRAVPYLPLLFCIKRKFCAIFRYCSTSKSMLIYLYVKNLERIRFEYSVRSKEQLTGLL